MGEVIAFPSRGNVGRISIQVSYYPQDDGSKLFCVEMLFPDGTWDHIGHSRDMAEAWKLAGQISIDQAALLLPESRWPSRSHLLALGV